MEKRLKVILFILPVAILALGYFLVADKPNDNIPVNTPPPVSSKEITSETIISPDGKAELIMKSVENNDSTTYTFATKTVFTKTVRSDVVISIPFNTFSPDNKYFFLKETNNGKSTYFVPIDGKEVNISQLFESKYQDYIITDVTGWGGVNLIVINTDKIGGGIGPSFWFEVPSASFMRLSTRFN